MDGLPLTIDSILRAALEEDMPFGDVTTDALLTGEERASAVLVARQPGVICGLEVARRVFQILEPEMEFKPRVQDGEKVSRGDILADIRGSAASILKGERTALNFLQRMSGISTQTARLAELVKGRTVLVTDTRKTAPGLRMLDKYAVRMGGGRNHRFSLSDGVMIKNNHIRAAGGIGAAIRKVRERAPHPMKIEVETETLEQVEEALQAGADIIMLDNMDAGMIREAVKKIRGKALVEISGNIGADNILGKTDCEVDFVSVGSLTHSVQALDISLRFL